MSGELATAEGIRRIVTGKPEDPLGINKKMVTQRRMFLEVNKKIIGNIMTAHVMPGVTIAEIASGTGELVSMMPSALVTAGRYLQTELRPEFAAEARRTNKDTHVVVADAFILPFPDKSLEVVTGLNALDAIGDIDRIAAEVKRVLVPGGKFIHYHDVRPNLDWTRQQLTDNALYFPLANEGKFTRFQRVTRSNYNKAKASLSSPDKLLLRAYLRDLQHPGGLEQLRSDHPEITEKISQIVSRNKTMQARPTLTFREIFNTALVNSFMRQQFASASAEDMLGQAIITPQKVLAPRGVCGMEKGFNGDITTISDKDVSLNPGQFMLKAPLNVFIAQKYF